MEVRNGNQGAGYKIAAEDMVVFKSVKVYENVTLSHNAVYLKRKYKDKINAEDLLYALEKEGISVDVAENFNEDGFKVSNSAESWDIRFTNDEIYAEYDPFRTPFTGGIVKGDVTVTENTEYKNGLICTGTLTVEKNATLILSNCAPVLVKNLELKGIIYSNAEELGFKPGHVIGKGEELDRVQQITVNDLAVFSDDHAAVIGQKVSLHGERGVIKKDVLLRGFVNFDDFKVESGVTVRTAGGCWFGAVVMELQDDVTLDLSETEICVLEYIHKDKGEGFYDHTGHGLTKLGKNVRLIGDDTFIWLWFGRVEGAFAQVSGNITVKAANFTVSDAEDMDNLEVSEIFGSGTSEDPYYLKYHEKDKNYIYRNPRRLAIEAVAYNAVLKKFPDSFLFPIIDTVYGFTLEHLRAGNILIHTANDFQTAAELCDYCIKYIEE